MSVSVHLIHGSGLSVRDKFGWLSIEGADVPYILRELKEKFIPVKVVEKYILSYYPSTYPTEIQERPPLVCHYIKLEEVSLLNKCCRQQGNTEHFTKTDPVVKLCDFLDFFRVVKQTYPDVVVGRKTPTTQVTSSPEGQVTNTVSSHVSDEPVSPITNAPVSPVHNEPVTAVNTQSSLATDYGWLLIKDALVPYVLRNAIRFAPLNVIRGAAQLLLGVQMESTCATEPEITCLNDMCRKVGLVFTFQKNTALADMKLVMQLCPGCPLQDLPKENPMDYVNVVRQSAEEGRPHAPGATATCRASPPIQTVIHGCSAATPQSATRSLQALAQMAKGQGCSDEGPIAGMDEDSVMVIHTSRSSSRPSRRQNSGGKVSSAVKPVPVKMGCSTGKIVKASRASPGHSASSSPGLTTTDAKGATVMASNVSIKPMECLGKTISCLMRGKTGVAYALVEAVCRVYFPTCSLVDFIHFLELELAVTLYVLKRSEENTFIEFYGIPTKQLRCNQVIKLQDLRDRMGWLQRRFGGSENQDSSEPTTNDNDSQNLNEDKKSDSGNEKHEVTNSQTTSTSSETTNDVVTMATNAILAAGDVTINGLVSNESENDAVLTNATSNGRNKNLEHTIMRLLHDKKDHGDDETNDGSNKSPEPEEEYKTDDNEYYPELGNLVSQSPDGAHSPNSSKSAEGATSQTSPAIQQRAPSINKRKGAPPRKCLASAEKKAATFDAVEMNKPATFTEDSDLDEYE